MIAIKSQELTRSSFQVQLQDDPRGYCEPGSVTGTQGAQTPHITVDTEKNNSREANKTGERIDPFSECNLFYIQVASEQDDGKFLFKFGSYITCIKVSATQAQLHIYIYTCTVQLI